jgi:hypothetical protein
MALGLDGTAPKHSVSEAANEGMVKGVCAAGNLWFLHGSAEYMWTKPDTLNLLRIGANTL